MTVANVITVCIFSLSIGNHTIVIPVIPDAVTGLCTVKNGLAGCTSIVNLLLVLPDTAVRHAIEITDGLANLCTVDVFCTLRKDAGSTIDVAILVGDTRNLVLVGGNVHTNVVTEVAANLVVPGEGNFNTLILYVTTIDVSGVRTLDSNTRSNNEPVLGRLLIPVEGQA